MIKNTVIIVLFILTVGFLYLAAAGAVRAEPLPAARSYEQFVAQVDSKTSEASPRQRGAALWRKARKGAERMKRERAWCERANRSRPGTYSWRISLNRPGFCVRLPD